jgi:tRNA uridine 5-carboxymethylaminomethyl modification enzyme
MLADEEATRIFGKPLEHEYSLHELLRRPDVSYLALMTLRLGEMSVDAGLRDPQVIEQVEIQAKYQGYIERQQDEVSKNLANEETRFPDDFDFAASAVCPGKCSRSSFCIGRRPWARLPAFRA